MDDCKYCNARYSVKCEVRESSCGGYSYDKYECTECKEVWTIDGIDS